MYGKYFIKSCCWNMWHFSVIEWRPDEWSSCQEQIISDEKCIKWWINHLYTKYMWLSLFMIYRWIFLRKYGYTVTLVDKVNTDSPEYVLSVSSLLFFSSCYKGLKPTWLSSPYNQDATSSVLHIHFGISKGSLAIAYWSYHIHFSSKRSSYSKSLCRNCMKSAFQWSCKNR